MLVSNLMHELFRTGEPPQKLYHVFLFKVDLINLKKNNMNALMIVPINFA